MTRWGVSVYQHDGAALLQLHHPTPPDKRQRLRASSTPPRHLHSFSSTAALYRWVGAGLVDRRTQPGELIAIDLPAFQRVVDAWTAGPHMPWRLEQPFVSDAATRDVFMRRSATRFASIRTALGGIGWGPDVDLIVTAYCDLDVPSQRLRPAPKKRRRRTEKRAPRSVRPRL